MKTPWRWLCLLVLPLFGWHCGSTTYTAEHFPTEDYLMFGQGGGFAGSLTTHYLLPNGQLFKSERIGGAKLANGKIGAARARKLLKRYRQELQAYDFNQPGNRYYFVEYVSADTTHALQWGQADKPAPTAVTDFYDALLALPAAANDDSKK